MKDTQAHKDLVAKTVRKSGGKYTQILRKVENGVDFERHEYVSPNGGAGYSVILYAEKDGKQYTKIIGKGPEAASRNHDWAEVVEDNG